MFWSRLFSVHCYLSSFMHGSHSCSFINFLSFMGSVISMSICTWSVCCRLMLPILHSMTSSITCVITGGNSLKGKYPNSFPSSSGCNNNNNNNNNLLSLSFHIHNSVLIRMYFTGYKTCSPQCLICF